MISKSWSTSKKRAALYRQAGAMAEFCLQLFPLLVVHSDDYGRIDGDPETVKLVCDPGSPRSVEDFDTALGWLRKVCLIQQYEANSARWIQIVNFDGHQPGLLSKRTTPRSPTPPTDTEIPESGPDSRHSLLREPNLTQPNSTQLKKSICAETSSAPQPALLSFPVVGPHAGDWPLTAAQVAEWAALFPGLDVLAESRKALAWVKASPRRKKTAAGMARFLVGWLSRSNDRGGVRASSPEPAPQRAEPMCPHSPPCPAPGRWACQQKTASEAYKAAHRKAAAS